MNEHSREAGIDRSHFRLAGASLLMFEQKLIQSVADPGTPCCVCQAPEPHRGNLTAGLWMVGCESALSDRGAGPQLVNGLGWCSKGNARVRDMAFWARGRFATPWKPACGHVWMARMLGVRHNQRRVSAIVRCALDARWKARRERQPNRERTIDVTRFILRWAAASSAALVGLLPLSVGAMDMVLADNFVTLSGPVVDGDFSKFQEAVAAQPGINTVVLKNSYGGDAAAGYRIGELIRELGLTTVVSGYCVSSCSRMFLGGKVRLFSDDQGLWSTYVAFHGHYHSDGRLNRKSVERMGLYDWIIKFSDGKADAALVQRWIAIERNTGMVAFMHPDARLWGEARTFICDGREARRPQGCEGLPVKALDLGVVTGLALWRRPVAREKN